MNLKNSRKKDMINMVYQAQTEKIDEILKKTDKKVEDELEKIEIERIIEDSNCKKELRDMLRKIEDNYNMKVTEYNKEMYKQGFIDGVNLILNCLKE